MAAAKKLSQLPQSYNPVIPRYGVVTLSGYGIVVKVDRNHLFIDDGIAADRRQMRFPRVGHGLKRLVIIGSDGVISLAALRWLSDVGTAVSVLERDGTLLFTTGPVRSSDSRLRRAQGMAMHSGAGLNVARELINKKLAGQERVARHTLLATHTADVISRHRAALDRADSPERIRELESLAAAAYWAAFRMLPINFPKKDNHRLPTHWRTFGTRVSPLTASPRRAVNPCGAVLNYLYAILESECRLAIAALGMDPGLGVLHVDVPMRDSLACDLMEAIRPEVDDYFLQWVTRKTLRREWFFEQRDGNCRLMAQLAIKLSETAPMWGRAVAPLAEWVAATLWSGRQKASRGVSLPTRLTQSHKREAKGGSSLPPLVKPPGRDNVCRGCGKTIDQRSINCERCELETATARLVDVARMGRVAARSPEARAKHVASRRRHAAACSAWDESKQPLWLTSEVFSQRIQPLLASIPNAAIRSRIGVSRWYAGKIRKGYRPHPRHWKQLAQICGVVE